MSNNELKQTKICQDCNIKQALNTIHWLTSMGPQKADLCSACGKILGKKTEITCITSLSDLNEHYEEPTVSNNELKQVKVALIRILHTASARSLNRSEVNLSMHLIDLLAYPYPSDNDYMRTEIAKINIEIERCAELGNLRVKQMHSWRKKTIETIDECLAQFIKYQP